MYAYEVGKPYPEVTPPLAAGPRYTYSRGQHNLLLVMDRLRPVEVAAVRTDPCEFAVTALDGVILFLYRFGSQPWGDAPYSWHLQGETEIPSEPPPGTKALLTVQLVEAETAILKVIRAVSLSPDLTWMLFRLIADQARDPWSGPASYDATLDRLYERHSTEDLLRRALARCRGGA